MNQPDAKQALDVKADLFKALGHPVRLLILTLIKNKPRHGQELAEILSLNPATVSHHLSKLVNVGLLESKKDQYYTTYSLAKGALDQSLADLVFISQPSLGTHVQEDAYRVRVLNTFLRHGRLTSIPAQLKKRQVIMEKLVKEFEPDRDYTEREVNLALVEFHDDVATLRRGLIEHHLMVRDHGIYRRVCP